ncbi:hypothetical protein KKF91_14255 [Myxococcota bacterium]|nr:hypothetical protein [Myxococcota bacterium]MBU1896438.1 hypothetical protein [Myxococcota bacterium]
MRPLALLCLLLACAGPRPEVPPAPKARDHCAPLRPSGAPDLKRLRPGAAQTPPLQDAQPAQPPSPPTSAPTPPP